MFCRKCGKEIKDDSNFCMACGAKVDEKVQIQKEKKNKKANKKIKVISNFMIVVAVICIVYSIVMLITYIRNISDTKDWYYNIDWEYYGKIQESYEKEEISVSKYFEIMDELSLGTQSLIRDEHIYEHSERYLDEQLYLQKQEVLEMMPVPAAIIGVILLVIAIVIKKKII